MDFDNIMQGVAQDPRAAAEAQAALAQQAQVAQAAPQAASIPADGGTAGNAIAAILGPGAAPAAPVADPGTLPAADPTANLAPAAQVPAAAPSPQNAMQSLVDSQPRTRHSLLDILGRAADVIANVGGAPQQYQPSLDAATARATAATNQAQNVTLQGQKITSNNLDNGQQSGKMLQSAAAKLQAIIKANPGADVSKTWGILSQQAGLDPATSAEALQHIQTNPDALAALASSGPTDDKEKYSGNVVYAIGPDKQLHAFQPGTGANAGRDVLPAGFTAIDPAKFVDVGGQQVEYGTRSGALGTRIDKTIDPSKQLTADTSIRNTDANNTTREHIASGHDATTVQVAGMPARAKAGGDGGSDPHGAYVSTIQTAKRAHDFLTDLANDPDVDKATGNVQSRIPTQSRANIEAKVARIEGIMIPLAISDAKNRGLSRPAQAEVLGIAKGYISDLKRLDQTPAAYKAKTQEAAQFMAQMARNTTASYRRVQGASAPAAAPKPAAAGGWSVVKVQ